jgi:hypothetical protein
MKTYRKPGKGKRPRPTCTPEGAALSVGGVTLEGRLPRIVVFVRGGSDNRREWRRLAVRLCLGFEQSDPETGAPIGQSVKNPDGRGTHTAYVVYGLPQAIRELQSGRYPVIHSWHYVMSSGAPRGETSLGNKPPPARPRPEGKDAPLYGVPRADAKWYATPDGEYIQERFWVSQDNSK